jgi:hypothetical protein
VSAVSGDDPDPDPAEGGGDAPLADLADDVARRREAPAGELFEEAFSERTFEGLEEESVWSSIEEDDGASEFGAVGDVIEAGERTYVVSKRNFCERCRFFNEPPDVHCTHEGTEILEFVDMDHVRLHACPIVEERGLSE